MHAQKDEEGEKERNLKIGEERGRQIHRRKDKRARIFSWSEEGYVDVISTVLYRACVCVCVCAGICLATHIHLSECVCLSTGQTRTLSLLKLLCTYETWWAHQPGGSRHTSCSQWKSPLAHGSSEPFHLLVQKQRNLITLSVPCVCEGCVCVCVCVCVCKHVKSETLWFYNHHASVTS